MRLTSIRIGITIAATLTAIGFILLSHAYPKLANILLSIEVVLLPAIYIIGNFFVERSLNDEYEQIIQTLAEKISDLNSKYYKEKRRNLELEHKLKND